MNHAKRHVDPRHVDPPNRGRTMYDEADIGSGERTPGEQETEEMIRSINPQPPGETPPKPGNPPHPPAKPRP